ncbi:3'(2'),5'-bisphosphate nucleotidase CysQ family protein [Saccharibacter floricola]|uniref:Exopolysaccharide production protein n=1 Tax=Saccharibacter floricola DSM 15669 TaxID=1123227 RepID=A0ABQ0NX55_9PROT|nr:3'(2'),5'-bisphosphate nucleotidase CysQ [Saccharibacter floricola]GBQ05590.1 exopolysaccharide production protein [Saccharibacter floricola DSM 15669]
MSVSSDTPRDRRALLSLALEVISEAADIVNTIRERGFRTMIKADSSPVTEADQASEAHILSRLREAYPDIAAIAEEEHAAGIHIHPGSYYWLIDPLDGTKGFAAGGDDFAINIGLVHNDQPVLGAVALPAFAQFYSGGKGLGAFRHDAQGTHTIKTVTPSDEGLRVLASSHHGSETLLQKWLAGRPIHSITRMGSAAKLVRVAEGAADFYPRFGPTMEWDTAAPQAILEEAGGHLYDEHGHILRYGKEGWKNPPFYCTGFCDHPSSTSTDHPS